MFEYTQEGVDKAVSYLKEIGEWKFPMGYGMHAAEVVQWANHFKEKGV